MKKALSIFAAVAAALLSAQAQTADKTDRIAECKRNYAALFGGEALTGEGADPEMMDILQKFIFGEVFAAGDLTLKQREMITCVVLSTLQTLPQLKAHAAAALNVGVSPAELREAIYLTAPFIGFPRTLNALSVVNGVFGERGISLPLERGATADEDTRRERGKAVQEKLYKGGISEAMEGVPANLGESVANFLTDFCFGDIYTRGALDLKTRELLGYCVLTALGAESQLRSHYHGGIRAGNTPEELAAAVVQCLPYTGFPAAIKALKVIKQESAKPVLAKENFVRLSKITVDPERLEAYSALLKEEIEASMLLEPGVLVLYAASEKNAPHKVTILEIYADRNAYEKHLKTPHFRKYKEGTAKMVKNLELLDVAPLIPGLKIK